MEQWLSGYGMGLFVQSQIHRNGPHLSLRQSVRSPELSIDVGKVKLGDARTNVHEAAPHPRRVAFTRRNQKDGAW